MSDGTTTNITIYFYLSYIHLDIILIKLPFLYSFRYNTKTVNHHLHQLKRVHFLPLL